MAAAGEDGEEAAGEARDDGKTAAAALKSIPNHESAKAALKAAEGYFRRNEPSSPALILVHQAGNLIGRPLTEALTALMPTASAKAALRIEGGYQFDIDLARMKSITESALAAPLPELPPLAPPPPPPPPPPPVAAPVQEPAPLGAESADGVDADGAPVVAAEPPPPPAPVAPPPPPPAPAPPQPVNFVARTRGDAHRHDAGNGGVFPADRAVEPDSAVA